MMQALGSVVLAGLSQRGEAMQLNATEVGMYQRSAAVYQRSAAYWYGRAQRELDRAEARKAVGLDCETALVCALIAQQNAAGYSKRARTLAGAVCAG